MGPSDKKRVSEHKMARLDTRQLLDVISRLIPDYSCWIVLENKQIFAFIVAPEKPKLQKFPSLWTEIR